MIVLSGPSGVGKDATLGELRRLDHPWSVVVTATTRPKRPGEADGVDYLFVDAETFEEMAAGGEFLEHAEVYGNRYGSPRSQVREAMAAGRDAIVKVDVQGAASIRGLAPDAVFIFLVPSSMAELERRLHARATETRRDLRLRTEIAAQEMESLPTFDYRVVNRDGRLEDTVAAIEAIVRAEKCRIPPRRVSV
jgi:guanylate kinase